MSGKKGKRVAEWEVIPWREYGDRIFRGQLGAPKIRQLTGLSERRSRTLCEHVHALGPRPTTESGDRTILVIGDVHAKPGISSRRMKWAARLALRVRPSVIVLIGDLADMGSVGTWNRGNLDGEGERYYKDIAAANEALEFFESELDTDPTYIPERMIFCEGNHEHRVERFCQQNPSFSGFMGLHHLNLGRWEVFPFNKYATDSGVHFVHHVTNKMGRAMGGVHHAHQLNQKRHTSFVVGHSHALDFKIFTDESTGTFCQGLVVGCYFEHDEGYAGQSNDQFFRGLVVLNDVRDGRYDLETWGLDRVRRTFARPSD